MTKEEREMLKLKLKLKHRELVKAGEYLVAREIFQLLFAKEVMLRSHLEVEVNARKILDSLGCEYWMNGRYMAIYELNN